MIKKKYLMILSVAAVSVLLGSLFVSNVILAQSGGEYDPWLDYNEDGIIDVNDLYKTGQAYGSSGKAIQVSKNQLGYSTLLLPVGAWYPNPTLPLGGFILPRDDTRLNRIDLNPTIEGDQQQVVVSPGEIVTINYTAWLVGNPGEIRQLWFSYSWASIYPPDAYTAIYNGGPYPSTEVSGEFNITAPSTPGTYKMWLCVQSQFSMEQAVNTEIVPPAILPHARISVEGSDSTSLASVPIGAVIPWAKSLIGVPTLPDGFVECNGQTLDDIESPLNGQMIPNLNGFGGETQRFLRGSTTSGATGGNETHSHTGTTYGVAGWSGANHAQAGSQGIDHVHNFETDESSNLPSYYEVVWIMRVK